MRITHGYFGSLELEDGYVRQERQLAGRTVEVDIDAEDGTVTTAELDALANACMRSAELCTLARKRVEEEYEELMLDAFSVWIDDDPSLLTQLAPTATTLNDVAPTTFANLLQLDAIHLQPGNEEERGAIVFDLRFGFEEPMDYLIAAEFSIDLKLQHVALES